MVSLHSHPSFGALEEEDAPRGPTIRCAPLVWRVTTFLPARDLENLLDADEVLRQEMALFVLLDIVHRLRDEGQHHEGFGMWFPVDEQGVVCGFEPLRVVLRYLVRRQERPHQLSQHEVRKLFADAAGWAPNVWVPCRPTFWGDAEPLKSWLRLVLGTTGQACCSAVTVVNEEGRSTTLRLWLGCTNTMSVSLRDKYRGAPRSNAASERSVFLRLEEAVAALDAGHDTCLRWIVHTRQSQLNFVTRSLVVRSNRVAVALPPSLLEPAIRSVVDGFGNSQLLVDGEIHLVDRYVNNTSHDWDRIRSLVELAAALGRHESREFLLSYLESGQRANALTSTALVGVQRSVHRLPVPFDARRNVNVEAGVQTVTLHAAEGLLHRKDSFDPAATLRVSTAARL